MAVPVVEGYSELVEVGRGGFSVVYRARQDRFDRVVALKVLEAADDPAAERRLRRECRAMGRLSWHPNVVVVYDSGHSADGRLWLAMEYHEAGSLGRRLQAGSRLSWDEVARVGVQVAGALEAAHRAGTVHQDVKPDNLLVGALGRLKLADFGIASVAGATQTSRARSVFSLAYVPPEVLDGAEPDARSDVYGLAATLYALAEGRPAFVSGPGQSQARTLARTLNDPPPWSSAVPERMAELVQRSMAKDPGDRPQTAEAFGRALQAVEAEADRPVTDLIVALEPVPTDDSPDVGAVARAGAAPGRDRAAPDPESTVIQRPSLPPPLAPPAAPPAAAARPPVASGGHPRAATTRLLAVAAAALLAVVMVALEGLTVTGLVPAALLAATAGWATFGAPRSPR